MTRCWRRPRRESRSDGPGRTHHRVVGWLQPRHRGPATGSTLESAGHRDALLLVLEVLEMEAEAREQRKITRLRRAAQIPPGKTFETLEANTLPAPLMRTLRELARGEFLERAENALAFGLPDPAT